MSLPLVVDYASEDQGGPPNVAAAKAGGVVAAIIRRSVCYYDDSNKAWRIATDPTYERDAPLWRAAGVVVGSYGAWSFHAGAPSIAEQVACFVSAPGTIIPGVDLPPASDVEFNGKGVSDTGRSQAECFGLVKDVDAALTSAYKVRPLTYTSHVQWCDDNGLGGPAWPEGAGSPLWIKTPYRLGAGQPLDTMLPSWPHAGTASWDPHDYWRFPTPWEKTGAWMQQFQGDARMLGFNHQVDVSEFLTMHAGASLQDPRWKWVAQKLGAATGSTSTELTALQAFQKSEKLVPDGVIGPRTFSALAWV